MSIFIPSAIFPAVTAFLLCFYRFFFCSLRSCLHHIAHGSTHQKQGRNGHINMNIDASAKRLHCRIRKVFRVLNVACKEYVPFLILCDQFYYIRLDFCNLYTPRRLRLSLDLSTSDLTHALKRVHTFVCQRLRLCLSLCVRFVLVPDVRYHNL